MSEKSLVQSPNLPQITVPPLLVDLNRIGAEVGEPPRCVGRE